MEAGSGHHGRQMCKSKRCLLACELLIYFQIRINHKARFVLMIGFAEGARD